MPSVNHDTTWIHPRNYHRTKHDAEKTEKDVQSKFDSVSEKNKAGDKEKKRLKDAVNGNNLCTRERARSKFSAETKTKTLTERVNKKPDNGIHRKAWKINRKYAKGKKSKGNIKKCFAFKQTKNEEKITVRKTTQLIYENGNATYNDLYKNKNKTGRVIKRISYQKNKSQKEALWPNEDGYVRKQDERRRKWRLNSGVLISLMMLNVAGMSNAIEASTFSSALTSRMIASFLGYPSTCSLGSEVRPCTLTLTCWLRGGTRLRGCGGWLFSCCGPEPSTEVDNSIPSSDWKYKMSPPMLRQVPQRSVLPNNVFRRRVDDDVTQMDCGLPSSRILQKRIIGGREARFAEFPWQAHVRISEFQCGGVLVSHWFVATAAHCVSRAHVRDIAVWLGAIDTSATHHPARKIGVVQKILHPLFQFRMTQPDRYDIALLKLARPITYMSHILPICLPDYDMELRGRSGVIAGWGKTDASNSHTGTNLLRSATVPILSKEQCINWHQSKQISVEIHSEMICAGHSDGHQDACLGDSGGPLIVLDNGRYYLVGITSAGFGCGVDHQPGIYHNVKVTANWIRGVISPSVNYIDV